MQIAVFAAAGGQHGIPVLAVEEFVRPVPVTPVPPADRRVAGLMHLRGKIATVIDLRACFRHPVGPPAASPKMILPETADRLTAQAKELGLRAFPEPVALRGSDTTSENLSFQVVLEVVSEPLKVDRVLDVVAVAPGDVKPRPAHVAERFVAGVFRRGDAYVSLLDLPALLDDILNPRAD